MMNNFFEKNAEIRLNNGVVLTIVDDYRGENDLILYKVKQYYPVEKVEILTQNQLLLLLENLNKYTKEKRNEK